MMKIEEIKKILPHRYPFLLVDRVLEIEDERILTLKNLTVNEEFFNGHFPERPMMPAVLQTEALAQSGCILLAENHIEDSENKLVVFTGIKKAKFRRSVVPGDQLKMEVIQKNLRRNFAVMEGIARVDGEVACELEISAAIVNKEDES